MPLGQLIRELRISRQSAGQLVDALVARGYLDRSVDSADRRKLSVALTERGRAAAAAQAAARERVDAALAARIGRDAVDAMRAGLAAHDDQGHADAGDERKTKCCRRPRPA
ncbi:MAG: MarR family winged helix-turn-helix transcriptional regulator, partial [Burkholderiaceae bacterium]